MIQKQFFHVFQLFAPEVKHFHQKHTWKIHKSYSFRETGKEFAAERVEIFVIYSYLQ